MLCLSIVRSPTHSSALLPVTRALEIGTRCNLEVLHAYLAVDAVNPCTAPIPGLHRVSHPCSAPLLLLDSVAACGQALTAASPCRNASLAEK